MSDNLEILNKAVSDLRGIQRGLSSVKYFNRAINDLSNRVSEDIEKVINSLKTIDLEKRADD